jgi:hypothetical protein
MPPNACLPRLLDSGMKFTHYLAPNSLDLLNLRAKVQAGDCCHCQRQGAIVAHGYLRGYAESGNEKVTRGIRFFAQIAIQI